MVRHVRAVVYDRVSEADPESQAEHLRRCRDFASARDWDVVAEHADTASGFTRTTRRPGWDAVLRLIEEGAVDAVVVFAVSRAGRNVAAFARFIELCSDHGVTFASATEPIDTSGPIGRVMLTLLSGLAEMESATKRERALLGEAAHKRNKTFRGGNIGFGLTTELHADGKRYLVVDATEASLIQEAAVDVLNGLPLERVARRWNDQGVRTHAGNGRTEGSRWTGEHVRSVLGADRNVEHGILTASDRRRLVKLFDSRRIGRQPDRYLASGMLRCAEHDRGMVGRGGRYVCQHGEAVVHLSVRAGMVNALLIELAALLNERQPWQAQGIQDPSDDLIQQRERLIDEQRELGRSTMPLAVIEARAERLEEDIAEIDAELDRVAPRGRGFEWTPHEVRIRQQIKAVIVAPAAKHGARFDPDRLQVLRPDDSAVPRALIRQGWETAKASAQADELAAEEDEEQTK